MNMSNSRSRDAAAISTGTFCFDASSRYMSWRKPADGTTSRSNDGRTASLSTKLP